jgi:hypothetical protein
VQVWPPVGRKKFETLSYLPARSPEQLAKEIDYLIRNKWVPSLEFELEVILELHAALLLLIADRNGLFIWLAT